MLSTANAIELELFGSRCKKTTLLWLKMQKDNSAERRCLELLRVPLKVFLLPCGIFLVRVFPCRNLNFVLVVPGLNQVGFIRSTGYQVRIARILDRSSIKA